MIYTVFQCDLPPLRPHSGEGPGPDAGTLTPRPQHLLYKGTTISEYFLHFVFESGSIRFHISEDQKQLSQNITIIYFFICSFLYVRFLYLCFFKFHFLYVLLYTLFLYFHFLKVHFL